MPPDPKDEKSFREAFLNRSLPFLSADGAERLKNKTVAVAGCGGVGGASAITLARMGVGRFHLADPGIFDSPDMNRQWGANTKTLGKRKTAVYREWILDINPFAKVDVWDEGVQPHTLKPFLENCDLLIDCLDLSVSAKLRSEMFETARAQGIYAVSAPIIGFGSIIVVADPEGASVQPLVRRLESDQSAGAPAPALYRVFMPEHLDKIEEFLSQYKSRVPSIATAPLVASAVVSTEVLNALIGRQMPGGRRPIAFPQMFLFDFFRLSYFIVDAQMLLNKKEKK